MRMRILLGLAAMLAAPVLAAPAENGITDAWVRINPAPGRPSAGYFNLTNGAAADALVAAEVKGARVELHKMSMDGGVMRMRAIDELALKPGETAVFKPGGYHLMIFGLEKPGKSVALTLVFASGARRTVEAEVRMAGVMQN